MRVFSVAVLVACFVGSWCLKSWEIPEGEPRNYMNHDLDDDWIKFKKVYNRTYGDDQEEIKRRLYWEDTIKYIQQHNLKYDRGETSFYMGENDFSDMAEDEFEKIYLTGLIIPEEPEEYPEPLTEPDPEAPESVNWKSQGLVSSVKKQGSCGSCWAFSALGALEGQVKKKYGGTVKDLSEQQLVDCAGRNYGNYACRGGWMANAFIYLHHRGAMSEDRYPYKAKQGYCRYHRQYIVARGSGYKNVGKSEHSLQSSLATIGPVSIAADASQRSFWYYKAGLYNEPKCTETVTHAMLAVGYGTVRGGDYWLVKNSWGTSWGANGYVMMSRNKNNQCGIANYDSYPTV